MLAYLSSIPTPHFLIIRYGEIISTELNQLFFDEAYSLVNESPFLGKISQEQFWAETIYRDLSMLNSEEIESEYNNILHEYHPDIVLLFGCNPTDGMNIDWSEYEYKRILCGLKVFRAESNIHRIGNQYIYQINLQDPLSKNYNQKSMIRLLYWFGDRYYS